MCKMEYSNCRRQCVSEPDAATLHSIENVSQIRDNFKIIDKIGEGAFSTVFLAKLKNNPEHDQFYALKHIIPTSHPSRIEQELRCLQQIGGQSNVMGVKCCIREKDHVVIIMPYFPHDRLQHCLASMTLKEVQSYMKNLLVALCHVHKYDIIHRDIKPSNFLYNRKLQKYALVDFGLAHKVGSTQQCSLVVNQSANKSMIRKGKRLAYNSEDIQRNPKRARHTQQAIEGIASNSTYSPNSCTPPLHKIIKHVNTPASAPPVLHNQKRSTPVSQNNIKIQTPCLTRPSAGFKSPRRRIFSKGTTCSNRTLDEPKNRTQIAPVAALFKEKCQCFGKPKVCSLCVAKTRQKAARAGTPGYRSPEVLLKCQDQTTAVDIWAAGVMFLSLLTKRYPFFRADNDVTALAQIIAVLGTENVKHGAFKMGKMMLCQPGRPALDLNTMALELRKTSYQSRRRRDLRSNDPWQIVPDSAYQLLVRLLDVNSYTRITAEEALEHPFFTEELT